jgi:tRNA dihydrouridine synthase A
VLLKPYQSPHDRIAVAPMMAYTDSHCRYLLRLLHPTARLYTEMITAHALVYGDASRLLAFDASEHPVALQLGGADPTMLGEAARLGAVAGFDEINLNVGCPSDRVQSGRFGACLMAEPFVVADCMHAMIAAVPSRVAVTVKCRIGIDDRDDYAFLESFVETVRAAGVDTFIVHARKAVLSGLSPKQNREIPPLRYEIPLRLKQEQPALRIVLNGGLRSTEQVKEWLPRFDGVMLGNRPAERTCSLNCIMSWTPRVRRCRSAARSFSRTRTTWISSSTRDTGWCRGCATCWASTRECLPRLHGDGTWSSRARAPGRAATCCEVRCSSSGGVTRREALTAWL